MTTPTSVTRILGLGLTPGKFRGLQRISNPNGTLTMVALDQNSSMISMMKESLKKTNETREPSYDEIVEAKVLLARYLAPHASGLLVDAYYGALNTLVSGALPRETGLLVRVEKSGAEKNKRGGPLGAYEPGWSVAKIKRMGADAVKLLAQFEPTELDSAEHQFKFVQEVYQACIEHDILFLLEPTAFQMDGEKKDSPSFLKRKAETVIESARILSGFCDVYKAEFPGTLGFETDAQLQENLHKLDSVCQKPWVLLSAGVDFPDYYKQVEMAVKAGASGVLGGRAFWKEFFLHETTEARIEFARGECSKRVKAVHELVLTGRPWYAKYGLTAESFASIRAAEGWHFRYRGPAAGGVSRFVEGDVY
jgi:tagatose 1,6-diphosphate aldolase